MPSLHDHQRIVDVRISLINANTNCNRGRYD